MSLSLYYGVLLGAVKELYIVTVQNGSHLHIKVNAGINYDVRIDLGTPTNQMYYTMINNNTSAVQNYLLPMIEAHLNTDWVNNFNILAKDGTSGALDFFRTPVLYSYISTIPGMVKNLSTDSCIEYANFRYD